MQEKDFIEQIEHALKKCGVIKVLKKYRDNKALNIVTKDNDCYNIAIIKLRK